MANLFIISAPSGTGKTSLVKALIAILPDIVVSVSHTTRAIRPGEIDGVNYHFVDKNKFSQMLADGDFLEYAQIYDYQYGTAKSEVEKRLAAGQDVILEIEWQGARQVRELFPEAVSVFILPPTRETLRQRLQSRGQDSDEVIEKRLALATKEVNFHSEYDYLLVNDQFELTLSDLRSIIRAEYCRQQTQSERLQKLLNDLTQQ